MSDGQVAEKPVYHVAPKEGWVNDPNGPFMYQGKYHLFYQHLPQGCEWAFGLVWGHSVSTDLIHWQHLPHAVVPTAGTLDADGCFSGCACVDMDGTPIILYTGVRLRTNPDAAPLPPPECDLHLPFIEAQLYAVPRDPDNDPLLIHWVKEAAPFIGLPPPNMNLTGWRDPFVVERPCEANDWEWIVLMGSGIKEVGGATIVYRTRNLRDASSWRYDGLLCSGDGGTGAVWECPLLAELNPLPASGPHLGSSAHERAALGSRRSYTQLHLTGGGSSNSTLSGMLGVQQAEQQQQHAAGQQQVGRPADKQQQHQQQVADKQQNQLQQQHQQHQQQQQQPSQSAAVDGDGDGGGRGGHNSSSSGGHNSSSSGGGCAPLPPPAPLERSNSSQQHSSSGGQPTWPGPLSQGAPYAVCQSGAAFPAFISSSVQLGSYDDRYTHFYSISPDACTNPTIFWLGRYAHGRFDLDHAIGPFRLDLGDVLYAPNVMRDDGGRVVLWGWLQEKRTVGTYDYAGCMTVPRLLHLDGDRLHQSPAPELLSLRRGESWQCGHVPLGPESTLAVPGVVGSNFLDIEVVFSQGTASTVGILLRSWHQAGEGGAAVLFNWETSLLEVVFEALDPATMTFSLTAPLARRIGGNISHKPGVPLALRLLLDGSCLEIFTGGGEVLSTRVYRGTAPHGHADPGIEFVALDGEATLARVAAYDMASIWTEQQEQQQAAVAAAVEALEGLDLETLDLLSSATKQEQAQVEKALSLTHSLGSRSTTAAGGLSLSSSLRDGGMFGPLSPALSSKAAQQLLLSPTASATGGAAAAAAAAMAAAAAAGGGWGGLLGSEPQQELPMEEMMTADIFDLE